MVEGKLDVATDCRMKFGGIKLHDLSSRKKILDVIEVSNLLSPQLEQLAQRLNEIGIYKDLSFSMYGPLDLTYVENYFAMLLMGQLNIYNQLIEKYQEIQILIGKLKNIVQSLRDKIGNL